MAEMTECGGPVIDAGGSDIRCVNCGWTVEDSE